MKSKSFTTYRVALYIILPVHFARTVFVVDLMPSLYNYITVDPDVFLSQPSHMEMIFNICRAVSISLVVAATADDMADSLL